MIAAVADDPEMVSLAMKLGNAPDLITSVYDGTALIAAAHFGHHDVVARLVEGGAPLDHINNLAWTALIEAVVLGDGGDDHIKTVQTSSMRVQINPSEIATASHRCNTPRLAATPKWSRS